MKNTSSTPSRWKKSLSILIWVIIIVGIVLIVDAKEPFLKDKICPDHREGNANASLTIKYFYTPYCPYCWLEKPILEELVTEKGSLFRLEHYDYRFCEEAQFYRVPGVPSFVFVGNETQQLVPGFMSKERLIALLCSLMLC